MKPKIIKNKYGKLVFIDSKGREWYADNLQELVDLARKLRNVNSTLDYYFSDTEED